MVARRLAIESASIVVRRPSNSDTRQGLTIRGQRINAVLENVYEWTSHDSEELEVWCYTERLSYTPSDTVRPYVNTTVLHYALQIAWVGMMPGAAARA